MTPAEQEQFENEQLLGSRAQHAYDNFVAGFIAEKREMLWNAFRSLPLSAEEDMMEVKRMLYAVDTLETEILTVIETGKMASMALNKEETQH